MQDIIRLENKLGFDKVREYVINLCSTEGAKEIVINTKFLISKEKIEKSLILTDEMVEISMMESSFPSNGYIDILPFLLQLEQESYYLDVAQMSKLRTSLDLLRQLINFFSKTKEEKYPNLKLLISDIVFFPQILNRIDLILDRFGQIKDNASEELLSIRRSIRSKEGSISKKMDAILKKGQADGFIDIDATVSVREGKMLVPVPAANKRRVQGFIVDESATGKTLYIEPIEIVELNNQVKELYFAEQREILRILIEFSDFLRPYAHDLTNSARLLTFFDFLWAKARFSISIGAGRPLISHNSTLFLKNARHPLLEKALKKEGKEIVPLNVTLTKDRYILLISGPNAGGKSVCLKTVGLLQYMLQCGFLIPADQTSELPIFNNVFVDIGDEQSIENDLSTYSSHLKNMKHILENADGKSLFLIDEFGAGTEPTAGGAIAEAILSQLESNGAYGIITTHYSNLKFYANSSKGVINGGMQFDTKNIMPLFKLEVGVPGSSFAFELARKMGLPENLVKDAESRAGSDFVDIERQLKKISKNRRAWEERVARIKSTDRTLESITERYQKELSEIQALRKKAISDAKSEASQIIAQANKQIELTIKEIRESQANKEKTKELRKELNAFSDQVLSKDSNDEVQEKIAKKMEQLKRRKERRDNKKGNTDTVVVNDSKKQLSIQEAPSQIKVGDKVKISGGSIIGEIIRDEGSKYSVAVGSVISKIDKSRVEKISSNEFSSIIKENQKNRKFSVVESDSIRERRLNFSNSIDIRGERLESAINIVTSYIDDALMVGVDQVRILHGKGNGILREEIRKYLKTIGGVVSLSDEKLEFGGAGITIVKLG